MDSGARLVLSTLALLALLGLGGCDDPSCVFGPGNCRGTGGGSSGTAVGRPQVGSWILDGPPELVASSPSGNGVHPQSVIVLEFDESLDPESLVDAFELFDVAFQAPVALSEPALVGDGRLVVLAPSTALAEGRSFELRLEQEASIRDLSGQVLARGTSALTSFGVTAPGEQVPEVVTSYPRDGAAGQSDIGQIVVVFDRPMDATSFDESSWLVEVDGASPAPDPDPTALFIDGAPGRTLRQVWLWTNADADGERVTLAPGGSGGSVALDLSPEGAPLRAEGGGVLPPTTIVFDLAEIAVPRAVRKHPLTEPPDAIGSSNLTAVTPLLEVELRSPAQPGDRLGVVVFGRGPQPDDPLIALARSVPIDVETGLVEVLPATLDLLDPTTPNGARVADGELTIAVRHERGSLVTPVGLADADEVLKGIQDLLFDVTPPTILGLGADGSMPDFFRSELAGVALTVLADEEARIASVRLTDLGLDNGAQPGVASSDGKGLFVTRPVLDATGADLGILDTPSAFSLEVFDRALNPAALAVTGTFTQLGVVGPDPVVPGDPIRVHVYDALDLSPLPGVLVQSEEDTGTSVDLIGVAITNASGNALVTSASTGTTVLTAALEAYDLITLHGLRSDRVHLPLRPIGTESPRTIGEVLAGLPEADVRGSLGYVGDSRVPDDAERLFPVDPCSAGAGDVELECSFGPEDVQAGLLGAQAFLAADFELTFATFSAAAFLEAFALDLPRAPLGPGATESASIRLSSRLSSLSAAEQAVALPAHVLSEPPRFAAGGFGVVSGDPLVTVEGLSPGIPGSIPVGLGIPFPGTGATWDVLGAYPGDARGGPVEANWGALVVAGTLAPDLFVRAELQDEEGARVGRRVRLSTTTGILDPPDLPVLRFPNLNSGSPPYELEVDNSILDAHSTLGRGLYRVVLTDGIGRRWNLWRVDVPDGDPRVSIHVPLLPVPGLANGTIRYRASAWTWPEFDPGAFLWSEVARRHEHFALAAEGSFSQP